MEKDLSLVLESLKNEVYVYKCKLKSKYEALEIMSRELDKCQSERDQFKQMAEQVQQRYQALRKSLVLGETKLSHVDERRTKLTAQQLNSLLHESREANKGLQFEVEELKGKLTEARGDIKLLRSQLTIERVGGHEECSADSAALSVQERATLIANVEDLRDKVLDLTDVSSFL